MGHGCELKLLIWKNDPLRNNALAIIIYFLYGQSVGREGVNNSCGQMAHTGTMDRCVTLHGYVHCVQRLIKELQMAQMSVQIWKCVHLNYLLGSSYNKLVKVSDVQFCYGDLMSSAIIGMYIDPRNTCIILSLVK